MMRRSGTHLEIDDICYIRVFWTGSNMRNTAKRCLYLQVLGFTCCALWALSKHASRRDCAAALHAHRKARTIRLWYLPKIDHAAAAGLVFLRVGGEGRVVGIQMSRIGDALFEISQPRIQKQPNKMQPATTTSAPTPKQAPAVWMWRLADLRHRVAFLLKNFVPVNEY